MRFGFAIPAYGAGAEGGAIADLIGAGEELGFDSVWLPDHVAVPEYAAAANLSPPFLEPLATCAWGLGATKRLRFGTDVLVAPYRHPLVVAANRDEFHERPAAAMAVWPGEQILAGRDLRANGGTIQELRVDVALAIGARTHRLLDVCNAEYHDRLLVWQAVLSGRLCAGHRHALLLAGAAAHPGPAP